MQRKKKNVVVILLACKSDEGYLSRKKEEEKGRNDSNKLEFKNVNVWSLECSSKTGINIKNIFVTTAELVVQKSISKLSNNDDEEKFDPIKKFLDTNKLHIN